MISTYDTFDDDFANVRVEGNKEGTGIVRMYIESNIPYAETWSVYLTAEN